jgi:hypothetical protein
MGLGIEWGGSSGVYFDQEAGSGRVDTGAMHMGEGALVLGDFPPEGGPS